MDPDKGTTTAGTTTLAQLTGTGPGQEPGGDVGTFTQEEVNAIVASRAERMARQMYPDYDDLKAKADRLSELEQAQMSELEKAQARTVEAEAERDAARQTANDRLIMSAFTAEASRQGFADPDDAFTLADLAEVSIGEDGKVRGVEEAVTALAQGKPYLIGRRTAPVTDAGAGSGDRTTGGRLPRLTQQQLDFAKKMNVSPEAYAKQVAAIETQRAGGEVGNTPLESLRAENRQLAAQLQRMTSNGG